MSMAENAIGQALTADAALYQAGEPPDIVMASTEKNGRSSVEPHGDNAAEDDTRPRSSSSVGAGQVDFAAARTDRIINQQTTFAVALSKAGFYDKVIGAMQDGLDEQVALNRAVKTTPLVAYEAEVQTRDIKTGIQHFSAHVLEAQEAAGGPKRLDFGYTPLATMQRRFWARQNASASVAAMQSTNSAILQASPGSDAALAADASIEKLKDLINKMNAMRVDVNAGPASDFLEEPVEFRKIKKLHHQITAIANEYDIITENAILREFRNSKHNVFIAQY
ncbi:hypothetical protein HK105_209202 [Polyrhizophydium stewartii]|uniref:Uncharacterized protein n=1 Tax=Polyrhizophydium stewartii TaxID=2732419 RepID=A0ABR4MVP7_9FUNG